MDNREDQYLWVEKYRPQKIDDCVLPESIKKTFREYVESGNIPNFLFSGGAGVGKTTIAKALCNEIGAEYIILNGSDEGRQIETVRLKIKQFASTVSLTDAKKVIIMDEADYMNPDSVQPALRAFIEEFSNNCRFIFTCNFKHKIIAPLHSRCSVIDFKIDAAEKPKVASNFYRRVVEILNNENITFDQKVVAELVTKHFPDFRRILNELQRYSVSGTIDSGILINMGEESFKELLKYMKDKNFTEVRKWVTKNSEGDSSALFREFYDKALTIVEPAGVPTLVVTLGDYQYKAAFVADQEINIMAALTELMAHCKFK
jgi:DNA polymerase III delta prime subunit